MSNWTAAALIVGTGRSHRSPSHTTPSPSRPATVPATGRPAPPPGPAPRHDDGAHGPQVSHSVATTSASGVTTTTTTQVVNGKTVVTHVRHAPAFHDY